VKEEERQDVGVRESERIPSGVIISVYVSHVHIVAFIPPARGIAMGALVVGERGVSGGVGVGGRACWKTRMMMEVSSMKDLRLGSCLTCSGVLFRIRPISSKISSSSPVAMAVGSLVVSSCIGTVKENVKGEGA
jgi:hypothetical protein